MKLFGNGGGRSGNPSNKEGKEKKAKKPKKVLTKKQKQKRIIAGVAVVLALVGVGAAVVVNTVKPPDITPPARGSAGTGAERDNELEDDYEGDRIDDYFTFVVGAVDEDGTRTDSLMVVSFDTVNKDVNILNIPRDTMCNNGRSGANRKINAAFGSSKGIEQTKTEIKRLLGFTPDKYVILDFQAIADIVDAIGGVTYEVPFRMKYTDPTQGLYIDLQPGEQELTGEQTVNFLRWRKNNGGVGQPKGYTGSDEQRIERLQEFMKHLASEVLQFSNVTRIKQISNAVFNNIQTDLTLGEMIWIGIQSIGMTGDDLNMFTLPGYASYSYAGTSEFLSFFFPYRQQTLDLVNEHFNPYTEQITSLDLVSGPDKTSYSSSSSGSGSSSGTTTNNTPDEEEEEPDETQEGDDPEEGGSSGGNTGSGSGNSSGGNEGGSAGGSSGSGDENEGGSSSGNEETPAEGNTEQNTDSGSGVTSPWTTDPPTTEVPNLPVPEINDPEA